ncbi:MULTISPECIES: type 1 glutamine amidotransferase domain-containing protein [unclassified Halomonas]|uniref:type 1 glutamine amidotransferase domain-containing protein n=1 Tax=unclassified Halomonas TaxID=2609666 RepID=UPI0028868082|nr:MULTISPECIES: type 1 glutamine amidotransferase domain-containing protein [unclassified Halomonas]MDT0500372.1 type 1 glutamine amidotransferase domain-containing protein [Halomonas sp. PAR7]MDT0511131.1 type 1 glutamine amidotransferase domain-containing protein [Halomonas sp. LES1]MDT0593140.1 type 1 glutamine amidotransferase domain-containing protein [Halomonas sp. PAR8]
MSQRILMVLTSHDRLGDTGEPTGFWLEELAAPYYACLDAGAEVVLASPAGGQPPLDPKSDAEESQTDATRRFKQDPEAQQQLATTRRLSEVSADDFDAIFYPGGHGPLWDLVDNPDSIRLIETFWAQQKPVATVCHAPIVLLHARDTEGEPLVRGRRVTGFTNGEEEAVGLTEVVPQLVEEALKAVGADYSKADDFAPYTCRDGRLITGQNPPSSEPVAKVLLEALSE